MTREKFTIRLIWVLLLVLCALAWWALSGVVA